MGVKQQTGALRGERGIALITTLLIMMLMSALLIGFTTSVTSNQQVRSIDKERVRAFYAAQSGLEKLSADLATLFFENVAPNDSEIAALGTKAKEPVIPDVTFTRPGGAEAYGVTRLSDPNSAGWGQISKGPYEGLIALKTEYELDSSVRTTTGSEAHMQRRVETVAIPVFQFGIFSDVDLSFHAGANFNFGGRVHTNGNLFLANGGGNTTTPCNQTGASCLTLREKVTAVGEVVRKFLVNGRRKEDTGHLNKVMVANGPGATLELAENKGSVVDTIGSAFNSSWTNTSLTDFHGWIRNGRTGAKTLKLPVVALQGQAVDIVRRPPTTGTDPLYGERFFSQVSLRILLSDTQLDLSSLPGVTATAPVSLDGNWRATPPAGYGPVDATHPPIARSIGNNADTQTNGSTAATATTINVDAVAAAWRPAAGGTMTLTPVGGGAPTQITCTGRTTLGAAPYPNRFTGCAGVVAAGLNSTVSATIEGVTVSTTLAQAAAAGANTLQVNGVGRFANDLFLIGNTMIACTGNTTTSLLGCTQPGTAYPDNTPVTSGARTPAGTGVIDGFIKIEMQLADHTWRDVTIEILNFGFADQNFATTGRACGDPTPNAIIRLQRFRENRETGAGTCSYATAARSSDFWPNVLYDTREAIARGETPAGTPAPLQLGGLMHYVTLDVRNLSGWLAGTGVYNGGSGTQALSINGYAVYFSDRRNNRNASNHETGEYGFEDVINPSANDGNANGSLDAGEDVNANAVLDQYGRMPSSDGGYGTVVAGSTAPLTAGARPDTDVASPMVGRMNRALLFRRALKLTNGARGNIIMPGLTIASENPVYVQGDWNFDATSKSNLNLAHAATAIIADSVTVLSNSWNDENSLTSPYTPGNRARAAQSYYRFAVIAGKNKPFPWAGVTDTAGQADFGSDGGAHNFLRMLEGGTGTVNYRGSIATFYYSRQAVGVYKTGPVYGTPTRDFTFDTDFLYPAKLPPLTPVFRDLNALGFRQEIRPGR
jgi:hypothetical protein